MNVPRPSCLPFMSKKVGRKENIKSLLLLKVKKNGSVGTGSVYVENLIAVLVKSLSTLDFSR